MSDANAKSSTQTSKKEVKKSKINIQVVGGRVAVIDQKQGEYSLKMNSETAIRFPTPVMDLAKAVVDYDKYIYEDGTMKIVDKNGVEYVLVGKNWKKSRTRQNESR